MYNMQVLALWNICSLFHSKIKQPLRGLLLGIPISHSLAFLVQKDRLLEEIDFLILLKDKANEWLTKTLPLQKILFSFVCQ